MRLYGRICKVTPNSDGTLRVEGIASSEAEDDQGEIIRADAMRAAIPDYMRFPALREMHQLSAAGTTIEVDVGDDGATRIVARVVDPIAISKVKNQVYRGFSIGGRVTKRDPSNPRIITGIQLAEISLVDRPANPEATLEVWKASITEGNSDMAGLATLGDLPAGQKLAGALIDPVQIWHCGDDAHRHSGKAEAVRCIEKQAAGGANGGTQWEPLAKGEAAAPVDEPAETSASVAQEPAQPEVPSNPVEKSNMKDPAENETAGSEAAATKAGTEAETETEKAAETSDLGGTASGTASGTDTVEPTLDTPATPATPATASEAEPSETEQAVAKAAEVAALARAALNLPAGDDPPVENSAGIESGAEEATSGGGAAEPRYPLDTEPFIRATWAHAHQAEGLTDETRTLLKGAAAGAWKDQIDKAGPGEEAAKASLSEIFGTGEGLGHTARLVEAIGTLEHEGALACWLAAHDGGDIVERAAAALPAAAAALRELVTVPESISDGELLSRAGSSSGGIAGWIKELIAAEFGPIADAVEKAAGRHTAKNQMMLDKAYECAMQCAAMDGCSKSMGDHLDGACKMMTAAGAKGMEGAEKSSLIGELGAISKAGGHQALLDLAHFCLSSMGDYCAAAKAGGEDKSNLKMAHDHLCCAGASCDGSAMKTVGAEGGDKLAKAQAENETLRKSLGDVVSLVEQLVGKIDAVDEKVTRIDNQELAPRGLARTAGLGITKAQDNGAINDASGGLKSIEDIVRAVHDMPPSMEKAYLHMRLAHSDPRSVKVVSAAEAGMGA